MCLTLIVERVNGVVHDAVGAEALRFGQQTQQRGNLQPYRVIRLLGEHISIIRDIWSGQRRLQLHYYYIIFTPRLGDENNLVPHNSFSSSSRTNLHPY